MEAKVGTQSNRYVEIMEKILADVPLTEFLSKKRIFKDHKTEKIIDVESVRLNFDMGDDSIKSKPINLILRIELEPPTHVQKYAPPHRKKKKRVVDTRDGLISGNEHLILMRVRLRIFF